jgi:Na+/melibiose symporter-like transporter
MMIFQLGFYTDVFGIKATAAGTILLLARVIDAFIDPTVGILADRTNTRWGKYRPWVLWTAIPFGLFFVLAFTTPDISEKWKIIYAGVTYTLLMAMYSFNNTPYSALHGVMTSDIKERTSIASIRFVFAMAAAFIVQGLTLPLVAKFGQGNDQKGGQLPLHCLLLLRLFSLSLPFSLQKNGLLHLPDKKPRCDRIKRYSGERPLACHVCADFVPVHYLGHVGKCYLLLL